MRTKDEANVYESRASAFASTCPEHCDLYRKFRSIWRPIRLEIRSMIQQGCRRTIYGSKDGCGLTDQYGLNRPVYWFRHCTYPNTPNCQTTRSHGAEEQLVRARNKIDYRFRRNIRQKRQRAELGCCRGGEVHAGRKTCHVGDDRDDDAPWALAQSVLHRCKYMSRPKFQRRIYIMLL